MFHHTRSFFCSASGNALNFVLNVGYRRRTASRDESMSSKINIVFVEALFSHGVERNVTHGCLTFLSTLIIAHNLASNMEFEKSVHYGKEFFLTHVTAIQAICKVKILGVGEGALIDWESTMSWILLPRS
eukprot:PhF_6_TR29750/c0_g1_i1/m.43766